MSVSGGVWHPAPMQPPPGAAGAPIKAQDAFDVPVVVRWSAPLRPGRRPSPSRLDKMHAPWPTPGAVPSQDGQYRVVTTWRDVMYAAIMVGRDPTASLRDVPTLAWAEIVARTSPLVAYLGRSPYPTSPGGSGFVVKPNVVYQDGTEQTAQAAFGYRIGMTMAEWACRGLMGSGPTLRAETHGWPEADGRTLEERGNAAVHLRTHRRATPQVAL